LHGDGAREKPGGSGEYLGLVTLDVEFEEDATAGVVGGKDVVKAAYGDFFFVKVSRSGGGREVGVEHGKDGARVGVGRDVDFDLAVGSSERYAIGYAPERIVCGGLKQGGVSGGRGLEGEDSAVVAGGSALTGELAGVGTDVEDEIDLKLREEEAMAELLRGVDAGFPDLVTGSFYYGAEGVLKGLCHVVEVSRMAVAGATAAS
jgi:hypothetical protein